MSVPVWVPENMPPCVYRDQKPAFRSMFCISTHSGSGYETHVLRCSNKLFHSLSHLTGPYFKIFWNVLTDHKLPPTTNLEGSSDSICNLWQVRSLLKPVQLVFSTMNLQYDLIDNVFYFVSIDTWGNTFSQWNIIWWNPNRFYQVVLTHVGLQNSFFFTPFKVRTFCVGKSKQKTRESNFRWSEVISFFLTWCITMVVINSGKGIQSI